MLHLEIGLMVSLALGIVLGIWGILLARAGQEMHRRLWGKRLFVAALLALGMSSAYAAFHRAEGLVPLGLSAGFLIICMLWETPIAWTSESDEPALAAESLSSGAK